MSEVKEKKSETVPVSTGKSGKGVAPQPQARGVSAFDEVDRFMERLMDSMFSRRWLRSLRPDLPAWPELEVRLPNVDVVDRDEDILVRAEIPGVDKKDLEISVTDNMVNIRGESRQETREENGDFFRAEISRGGFSRTISLPHNVDGGKAHAVCKDGVLEVTLPKLERAKRHTIKVA